MRRLLALAAGDARDPDNRVDVPDAQVAELYLSSISWLEFAHVICKQSFLDGLAEEHRQRYELARWQERQIREQYVEGMLATARDLLSAFEVTELPITSDVQAAALDLIPRYRLDAQDACYVAVATSAGVFDLASLDEGFRRVDGLTLWNDLIQGRRP